MKESFFAALKRKSLTRTFYWQAAFTVLAFAAIVIIGYFAMNATIRNHLARNSEAVLDLALTKIEAELRGPETTLKTFAELAQQRLLAGTDANAILVLLIDLNRHLLAFDRNEVGYGYLFGIFYTLGPEPIFMHGSGWIPPDDYDAPNRPWHKAAVAGNGNQARSPLYRAMSTGQDVFAITQTIQDESGRLLAVVCIQVPIAPLGKIITETAKEQGGYGMLLDHNLTVLSHPNPDFVGLGVPDPALTFSIFHDNFIKGEDVFERPLTSFVGEESLAFFRKTQDDWYYGMIMPEAPYYNSITNIWYLLIGLGVVAAVFLIYTSARSETKKIRLEKAVLDAEQTLALREAEAKVREADELTHFMIEHAPFIVTLWDKDGQIIDCNQEAVKIFGLSSKKEYMDGFFERGPEYQPNGMNSQELFAKAHLRIFNETEYAQVEWTHNHAVTGEAIPLNVTLVRIKYKDGYAALSYGQDLRERYAAIAKIREADERTQLMTEYAPLVLMLWDKNLQILDCNQEAVRLFGLSSKKEYIERFFELTPEYQPNGMSTLEFAKKSLDKTLYETGYERIEWTMNHSVTGEAIPFGVTIVRIKYKDEYAVVTYAQDMRELKAAEEEAKKAYADAMKAYAEAETASEAKSRFIANMSHEMRTPMNVIVGLTDLMLEEDDILGKVKDDLKKINTAGNTLTELINDVLDISKIESGRQELNPVRYDAASLLNDIITLNIIRIGEKQITFTLDIDESLPRSLFGDDIRVKQILNNLLSNAFKYTKEGSVSLSVKFQPDDVREGSPQAPSVWVSFCVSDTGIGIRKEDMAKLFSAYNQVDTSANRKIEGTGLGLSISKKFVELMDGEISVESEYGKGSTFRVRIRQGFVTDNPIGKETAENLRTFRYTDRKKQEQGKLTRQNLSYAKVLVVDDYPMNLDVAAGMLRKYKMKVDCVLSGQEAVDRIAAGESVYNAIFMDHMMPGMDGVEATKAIRTIGTEYAQNIPIIALTANAVAGNEQMFLDNGFNAFLPKPFNAMDLDSIVQRWVKQSGK